MRTVTWHSISSWPKYFERKRIWEIYFSRRNLTVGNRQHMLRGQHHVPSWGKPCARVKTAAELWPTFELYPDASQLCHQRSLNCIEDVLWYSNDNFKIYKSKIRNSSQCLNDYSSGIRWKKNVHCNFSCSNAEACEIKLLRKSLDHTSIILEHPQHNEEAAGGIIGLHQGQVMR